VATNNAHYLQRDDATAQRALMCIASGTSLDEAEARRHGSEEMFLKSPEEMAEAFADYPEALANTARIAEMCKVKLELGKPTLPRFRDESGARRQRRRRALRRPLAQGPREALRDLQAPGQAFDEGKYRDRLEVEIGVIQGMKFPGYFLIVQDFINWGKQNGVPVGPGRGSGAGSIVAYALGITDIDPIPYDLLFERFLNPERVSMPDFDVDFCMIKREKRHRLRAAEVRPRERGQIATFQLLKSKSCVRDVGRVMGSRSKTPTPSPSSCPTPCRARASRSPRPSRRSPGSRRCTTSTRAPAPCSTSR
jgi:DNA polymerase-3 subunit alpha